MSELNKKLVFKYLDELHNQENPDIASQLVADNYIQNNPHVPEKGFGGSQKSVQSGSGGFSDRRLIIEHQVAEDAYVVSWGRFEGTRSGTFKGVPPTGKRISFSAMFIHRIENGKIAESWNGSDRLHQAQQIGAVDI